MSAFTIWAIILTGCYIVYYPVMIGLELYGKKGQKKDGVEEFNTGGGEAPAGGDDEEEVPTDVVDTGNGYRVGDKQTDQDDDEPEPVHEEAPQVPLTPEEKQKVEFMAMKDRLEHEVNQNGESINPSYQQSMTIENYLLAMQMPLSKKTRIKRNQVI